MHTSLPISDTHPHFFLNLPFLSVFLVRHREKPPPPPPPPPKVRFSESPLPVERHRQSVTTGDKKITYLIFTPDELFEVIPCVFMCMKENFEG